MTYTCAKCGWAWKPNTAALQHGDKPVKCPNCQTRQWEGPNFKRWVTRLRVNR